MQKALTLVRDELYGAVFSDDFTTGDDGAPRRVRLFVVQSRVCNVLRVESVTLFGMQNVSCFFLGKFKL